MSKRWKQILFALFLGAIMPAIIFAVWMREKPHSLHEQTMPTESEATINSEQNIDSAQPTDDVTKVPVLFPDDEIREIDLDTYLVSVLLGEMPVDFEIEALKAQAVVSRTYTLHNMENFKHESAAVCTNANCCQGFCSSADFLACGGTDAAIKRIEDAVDQTKGLVLTYDRKLIEATYFSCSGGWTEDAKAVWGTDVPYLQATESPGEENATHYMDTVTYTTDEFRSLLKADMKGPSSGWLEKISYTDGGGVATITLCGKTYSGTEIRKLLNLRSTAFALTAIGDTITITTKGFGHRVGMSQYGAEAMAVDGKTFEEILSHYYKNTTMEHYEQAD